MTERFDVFKCDSCGTVIEVMHGSDSSLVCCGQPMTVMNDENKSGAPETHIPVVEKTETGFKISVGSKLHGNTPTHTLYWIEVIAGKKQMLFHIEPGDESVVEVNCPSCNLEDIKVRSYCDLHGLWTA